MLDIIMKNETQPQSYEFNFEELKTELAENLEKFKNLVVSDDAIKEAKESRASLNKLKKEITTKVSEIKKTHLQPFDAFKAQADILIKLIDEPVLMIDTQIKTYEQKLKDNKLAKIKTFWQQNKPEFIEEKHFNTVFNDSWLNQTTSTRKVQEEILAFFQKTTEEIEVIKSQKSEFEAILIDIYLRNFNLSVTMREKAIFEQRKAEQLERERQEKERAEKLEAERIQKEAKEKAEREAERQLEESIREDFAINGDISDYSNPELENRIGEIKEKIAQLHTEKGTRAGVVMEIMSLEEELAKITGNAESEPDELTMTLGYGNTIIEESPEPAQTQPGIHEVKLTVWLTENQCERLEDILNALSIQHEFTENPFDLREDYIPF